MQSPPQNISSPGIAFIKQWEEFRAKEYRDAAGLWTIGYGHLIMPGEMHLYENACLTEPQACELLAQDLDPVVAHLRKVVNVYLSQRQFDALCSFVFNVGITAFDGSTLLRKLNSKDYVGATAEFSKWCMGGDPLHRIDGLARRREAERRLFALGVHNLPPSHLLYTLFTIDPLPLNSEYSRVAKRVPAWVLW